MKTDDDATAMRELDALGRQLALLVSSRRILTEAQAASIRGQIADRLRYLAWSFTAGQKPDVTQIFVEEPQGFSSKPIWNVILPGSELGVSLPPSTFATMPSGSTLYWTVMTARSPRFDYDRFGYQQLGVTAWTSFTQDFSSFTVP